MRAESYMQDYRWDLLDTESSDDVLLTKSKLVNWKSRISVEFGCCMT